MADADTAEEIGDRITEKRSEARLTQGEAAEQIGVSAGALGSWERGDTTPTGEYREAVEEWLAAEIEVIMPDGVCVDCGREPTLKDEAREIDGTLYCIVCWDGRERERGGA